MGSINRRRRVAVILMALVMVLTSAVASLGATPTKSMNTYYGCIKKGNYVYCATRTGIYRTNLVNHKVIRLVGVPSSYAYVGSMQIKGTWLYYTYEKGDMGFFIHINRVSLGGKRNERVVSNTTGKYAFSGDRIFFLERSKTNLEKVYKRSARLDGKDKRSSRYNVVNKWYETNAKGYRVKTVGSKGDTATEYLVIPDVKLGTFRGE